MCTHLLLHALMCEYIDMFRMCPNICVLIWLFHTYTCTGQILLLEDKSQAGTECRALAYDDTLVSWDEADHCCQGESHCCGEGQTCTPGSDNCGFRFICGTGMINHTQGGARQKAELISYESYTYSIYIHIHILDSVPNTNICSS